MEKNRHYQIPPHVTEIILESISDGVFTVDHEWRGTSFNSAAERITGIPREKALKKHCWEVFRSNMCETDCALSRTMQMGKTFVDTSTYIVDSQKRRIPVVVSTSLLKDDKGRVLGGEARGIEIVSFAAGDVDEILEAYIAGNIYRKDYRMPGCEIGNDTTL
jgi:PAS domain S-box-containing protein